MPLSLVEVVQVDLWDSHEARSDPDLEVDHELAESLSSVTYWW